MLSGNKLVNHINFRNRLLGMEPEAIGGEMEGTGIYSAAYRNNVDWIVVKAICDWADGQKNNTHQQLAAENAARFILHVLQQRGLAGSDSATSPPTQTPRKRTSRKQAVGTILCTYDIHSSYVVAVAWEPSGNRIASAGGD